MDGRFQASDALARAGLRVGGLVAGRYRVEGTLGVGAMGTVYRALDLAAGRAVALKVLHPEKAGKAEVLARFRQEAAIMREVHHPGIARIFDAGRTPEGIDYLVMEVLDGQTLRERLESQGALTLRQLAPIVVAVADALSAAHAKGVVHRDLKPDNVFLCADGVVKLVDFGLSRLDVDQGMTKTGAMIGTPRYMAPEQIRSSKDVDPRADVYALGVLAHEALTNASPFPASDAAQLLGCIIEGRVRRIEEQRGDLPTGLGEVVRRAMKRDRRERFATALAFAEAFTRAASISMAAARAPGALLGSSIEQAPPEPASFPRELDRPRFTIPEGVRPAPSRRPIARFAIALVVVACLAAALAIGLRALL